MGLILCEKHGESSIIQMSKLLYDSFSEEKKSDIVKLIFNVKEIGESFIHYFSIEEDISQFKQEMDIDYFESEFSKISGDLGSCSNCFLVYLNKTKSKIVEKEYNIS